MKYGIFGKTQLSDILVSDLLSQYTTPSIVPKPEIRILADPGFTSPGVFEYTPSNLDSVNFLYLPIGYRVQDLKRHKYIQAKEWGMVTPSHVSSKAIIVSNTCTISEASWIMAGAIVGVNSKIGTGVTVWTGCNLAHDVTVSDFTWISPGAILLGNSTVGEDCFIGAGSIIGEGVTIGSGSFIAAGAIVTKDVPDNSVVLEGRNNLTSKNSASAVKFMRSKLK